MDPPGDWRRRARRPRQSWLRTVEADLRPMNLGLATAKRRAQDRSAWQLLVATAMSSISTWREKSLVQICNARNFLNILICDSERSGAILRPSYSTDFGFNHRTDVHLNLNHKILHILPLFYSPMNSTGALDCQVCGWKYQMQRISLTTKCQIVNNTIYNKIINYCQINAKQMQKLSVIPNSNNNAKTGQTAKLKFL